MAAIDGFHELRLKSEQIRAYGMLFVLLVVAGIGVYHLIYNANDYPYLGIAIIGICALFALIELKFLFNIKRALTSCTPVPDWVWYVEAAIESIFPVVAMVVIMDVADRPFVVLLSPAYALLFIIIAASALRLNVRLTLMAGCLSALSYLLLVLRVLQVDSTTGLNPYPPVLYINMAIMIVVATVVAAFIAHQLKRFVETAVKEQVMQGELELASAVQRNLLPSPLPDVSGYEVAAISKPATQTGGDYYDCIALNKKEMLFMIADATGHGIGPALMTAGSRAYFRALTQTEKQITGLLKQANALLEHDLCGGRFITLAALKLNNVTHTGEYLSAGHAPTFLLRHDANSVEKLSAQAAPIGVDASMQSDGSLSLEFAASDMIMMFSDGIFECQNSQGEAFGIERLENLLIQLRDKPVQNMATEILSSIQEYAGEQEQSDDVTLMIIRRMR